MVKSFVALPLVVNYQIAITVFINSEDECNIFCAAKIVLCFVLFLNGDSEICVNKTSFSPSI